MLNSLPKWVYITIGSLSLFILVCAVSKCSYELGSYKAPSCVIKLQKGKVVINDSGKNISNLSLKQPTD